MMDDGLLATLAERLEGGSRPLRLVLLALVKEEEGENSPEEILRRYPVTQTNDQLREQEDLCRCMECSVWCRATKLSEVVSKEGGRKTTLLICYTCRPDLAIRDDPDRPRRGKHDEEEEEEGEGELNIHRDLSEVDPELRGFFGRDGDCDFGGDEPMDLSMSVRDER